MGLLDDIKQRERDRAAELDAFVERVAAHADRRAKHHRTKLAVYRPLIEEFSRESGWAIIGSGATDSSSVGLTGKGIYECRCTIVVQTDRIQGWIWERHVPSYLCHGGLDRRSLCNKFRSTPRRIDIPWLRSVLRDLYAQVVGVR